MTSETYLMDCRVCGLRQPTPPWGADGRAASFDFCACCGVQFGYQDATPAATKKYREGWLAKGSPWFDSSAKPADWDISEQMKKIPETFR